MSTVSYRLFNQSYQFINVFPPEEQSKINHFLSTSPNVQFEKDYYFVLNVTGMIELLKIVSVETAEYFLDDFVEDVSCKSYNDGRDSLQ